MDGITSRFMIWEQKCPEGKRKFSESKVLESSFEQCLSNILLSISYWLTSIEYGSLWVLLNKSRFNRIPQSRFPNPQRNSLPHVAPGTCGYNDANRDQSNEDSCLSNVPSELCCQAGRTTGRVRLAESRLNGRLKGRLNGRLALRSNERRVKDWRARESANLQCSGRNSIRNAFCSEFAFRFWTSESVAV